MLNSHDFFVVAGDPSEWDDEVRRRVYPGMYGSGRRDPETFEVVHKDQYERGRRTAELVKIEPNRWGVKLFCPGREDEFLIQDVAKGEALKVGETWAKEDRANREFIARKNDYLHGV